MDSATTDLARRLVACDQWRWMPGMVTKPQRGRNFATARIRIVCCDDVRADGNHVPDLDDPATWGCALAMLWEAWPYSRVVRTVDMNGDEAGWAVQGMEADTPGAAIAAALLEAWGNPDA